RSPKHSRSRSGSPDDSNASVAALVSGSGSSAIQAVAIRASSSQVIVLPVVAAPVPRRTPGGQRLVGAAREWHLEAGDPAAPTGSARAARPPSAPCEDPCQPAPLGRSERVAIPDGDVADRRAVVALE